MNKALLLLFSIFSSFKLSSQNNLDSLDLAFHSDFEKITYQKSLKDFKEEDFISSLLCIDSTFTKERSQEVKGQIDTFLSGIRKKTESYNPKKKVKYVFSKIHDRFFKKYELDAYFPDIFQSATYNCVTGTALYAYSFDYLDIPYQIKETPTHVFLVAYPLQNNIYVETTLPGKVGSYAPSEPMIKKAVDDLVKMKLVTLEYVSSVGYNKAFNDYYYGNENISKKDLIGIQYYNKGIFNLQKEDYIGAYQSIAKSRPIYQNEKTKLFSETSLAILVDNTDFNKVENFKWFVRYVEITNDSDYLRYKLKSIMSNNNWSDRNLELFEKHLSGVKKDTIKNKLLETYYSYLAEKAYKFQKTGKALLYSDKIYNLNSENINAKNLITIIEIDKLAQKNISVSRIDDLGFLVSKYPFVTEFGVFGRYKAFLYSFLVFNSYTNNQGNRGANYLDELEKILEQNEKDNDVDLHQESIGNAYGAVGAYFYRKGQKENAKKFLNRGLRFSPDNENIKRKLRLIKTSY